MSSLAARSLLLALSVVSLTRCSEVELEFHPPGPHKAGDTIKVLCRAKAGEVLDLVKIVKMVDNKEYEISTNDFMAEQFMDTGRYAMQWSVSDQFKEAGFSIRKAKGEDSGMIGCKHVLLNGQTYSAFEEFKIVVPPKSVELKHYTNGVEHTITDGKIVLKEGEDGGLECVVVMDGGHDSPQTTITLGGEDAMSKFSKEENKTKNPHGGLVQMKAVVTYEYLFEEPDLALNGQTLVCTAQVDGFEPLTSQADIEVHYKPRVECEPAGGSLGETVTLKCHGHMNPRLDLASVTWKRKPDTFTLTQSEPQLGRHMFVVEENDDGTYVFTLTIDGIEEQDFGSYKLEVQNSHDITEVKLKLQQVIITTTTTTTTTMKTQPLADEKDPPASFSTYRPVSAQEHAEPEQGAVASASVNQSLAILSILSVVVYFL